jgi:hemoglobin
MAERTIGPDYTPFEAIGVEGATLLAKRFYDHMDAHEPELVAVHRMDDSGQRVAPIVRERFTTFLIEWLGGPSDYSAAYGHPRLRMRHGHIPIDASLRDAWLRCMNAALDDPTVGDEVRGFLRRRFAEVAEFLRTR